mmetsp:Transcript_11197/g.24928  ORF Transcript_11197/g.24928 Transcript_11197/m.24928 type:complete len:256 (-) Transcript_11197:69-836(-)
MSIRTMWVSSSNNSWANAFASSVFPTPEVPKNMKLPWGRFGEARPARLRRIAEATASTAWSWPRTRCRKLAPNESSFSDSPSESFSVGIPVQRATIRAMCSGPTVSVETAEALALFSNSANCFRKGGRTLNFSWEALSILYLRSFRSIAHSVSSISFFTSWICCTRPRLASNSDSNSACRSRKRARSSMTARKRLACWGSVDASFSNADLSTSKRNTRRCTMSNSGGKESNCTLTSAQASSMRSIALSGIRRSLM